MSVKKYTDATGVAEIWAKVKSIIPSKTSDLTNDSSFITSSDILNTFYPVGSYYETSDTSFDPNVSWGGTWVLETAGLVHVSGASSGTYVVSNTYTSGAGTKQAGNKDAIIPYHLHNSTGISVTVPKHGHDFTQPTAKSKTLTGSTSVWNDVGVIGNTVTPSGIIEKGTKYASYGVGWQSGSKPSYGLKIDATHSHTCTGGAVEDKAAFSATVSGHTDYAGTSGNTTDANMQPYISIYRWHRTA